ncbi:hypothetical protein [Mycobacterium sp. 1245805.9]|uniref:hypothetical protein n=1 Tax=Mycobacterium sp. 1245805.9 TaxID=1856862 RepID=UPI0007FEACC7|nr:hypothetical protein [Mycobacterium sp. 1245805.9]OBI89161.1 hypothetical protein A9X00_21455 [Mycobacterium sp. 1245805.9]
MTNLGHQTTPRRRPGLAIQLIFAGAAAAAVLALFNASPPFPTDDTNFVNDNGQTSGDIFQQNAQDQN